MNGKRSINILIFDHLIQNFSLGLICLHLTKGLILILQISLVSQHYIPLVVIIIHHCHGYQYHSTTIYQSLL